MGHQIEICQTPEDLPLLEGALRSQGEMAVLCERGPERAPAELGSLSVRAMGAETLMVHLCRRADLDAVRTDLLPSTGQRVVDGLRSPVLEMIRGFFDGKVLRSGRLYYVTGYHDEAGQWVDKPEEFVRWAAALFRATRKVLQRRADSRFWWGPHAAQLHAEGAVVVE